jgi:hypothetical protein
MFRRFFPARGQSLFEWILLIALISIVAMALLTAVGRKGQIAFQSASAGTTARPAPQ